MRLSKRALPYFLLATLTGGVWLVHSLALVPMAKRFGPLVFPLGFLVLLFVAYLVPSSRMRSGRWLESLLATDHAPSPVSPVASPVLLTAILDRITRNLAVTHAWLLLRDAQAGVLRPIALSGHPPHDAACLPSWPVDDPALLSLQRENSALFRSGSGDVDGAPIWEALAAQVLLPVRANDSLRGLVALGPRHDGAPCSKHQADTIVLWIEDLFAAIDGTLGSNSLEQGYRLFESALQYASEGMIIADEQMRIVLVNHAAERLIGHSGGEAMGKPISTVLGNDVVATNSALAAIVRGNKDRPGTSQLTTRLPSDVLVTVTPLDAASSTQGYLFFLARKSLSLPSHPHAAEILAEVSHELRAPLANIRVYTELLTQNGNATEWAVQREWLGVIEQETERMAEQMETFLSLTRLESGSFSVSKAPLGIERVVRDVVASQQAEAGRRNVSITMSATPDLPEVVADERLVRMIAQNLISNAVKFSHEGGSVRVTLSANGALLRLAVEDKGIGIPQEAIPKLFTKFFRVPGTATDQVQGTGLGLALVKEAVAAHNGVVEVESTLGQGSCFTVSFPVPSQQGLHTLAYSEQS